MCTRACVILLRFMIHLVLNIYLYLYDMHIILVTRSPIFHTYITPCVYNINPFHNSLVYTASASPSLHTYSIQPGINITQFRLCNIEYPSRIHEISNYVSHNDSAAASCSNLFPSDYQHLLATDCNNTETQLNVHHKLGCSRLATFQPAC